MNILRSISFINDKHSMHENRVPLTTTFLSNSKCVERMSINHMEDVAHGNKLHKHYHFLKNPHSIKFSYLRYYFLNTKCLQFVRVYLFACFTTMERQNAHPLAFVGIFHQVTNSQIELINPERRRQDKELQDAECLLFLFFDTVSSWLYISY